MKEIWGVRLTDGRYHWRQVPTATARSRLQQESLQLNFRVDATYRDAALSLVINDLADKGADWAVPLEIPDGFWRIDLGKLAHYIHWLTEQTWLQGERIVIPDFDVVESPFAEPEHAGGKIAVVRLTLLMNSQATLASIPPAHDLTLCLSKFRRDHPDLRRTGFLMMPFEDTRAHNEIAGCVLKVCSSLGLSALRADGRRYSDDLLQNIRTHMHGSGFGIAVFERLTSEQFNPNVSLEVGYMLALGRPVCLLKDRTLSGLQADLIGRLYEEFDPQRVQQTIPRVLRNWLKNKDLV